MWAAELDEVNEGAPAVTGRGRPPADERRGERDGKDAGSSSGIAV